MTGTNGATGAWMRAKAAFAAEGGFVAKVATVAGGTMVAQAIGFASTPVLSRLFAPDDFGVLGLVNAVAAIAVGVAALRFDMAVVIPKEDHVALRLLGLSLLTVVAISSLASLAVGFLRSEIATLMDSPGLADWLWFVPLIILISGFYNSFLFWNNRKKRYAYIAAAAIVAATASAGLKIGAGAAGMGSSGLVTAQVLGQTAGALAIGLPLIALVPRIFASLRREAIAPLVRAYSEFPKYHAPMTIVNSVAQSVPVYVLGAIHGTAVVGHWAMAHAVLSAPVFLVANALRTVLLQRASETLHEGKSLFPLLIRFTGTLTMISVPCGVVGFFTIRPLLVILLGSEWSAAGEYAQLMLPWQISLFIGSAGIAFFPALRMQRVTLAWQLLTTACAAASLLLGSAIGDASTAILSYSITMAVLGIGFVGVVAREARSPRRRSGADDDASEPA